MSLHVKDADLNLASLGQLIADAGSWVERIGIISAKGKMLGKLLLRMRIDIGYNGAAHRIQQNGEMAIGSGGIILDEPDCCLRRYSIIFTGEIFGQESLYFGIGVGGADAGDASWIGTG